MPALRAYSRSLYAVSGVCSDGLMIIVQPAANAVATLRVIIMNGKFHGVIAVGPAKRTFGRLLMLGAKGRH